VGLHLSSESSSRASWQKIIHFIRNHKVTLSVLLAAYGTVYLASVVLGGWTISDWGKDVTGYPPPQISPLLPRSFINPLFFVTSFPALFVGTTALCIYSLRDINSQNPDHKQQVAILLATSGFTYQVIGAWPLGILVDFPWEWQKQIIRNGAPFAWSLYILSLVAFVVGGASLYIQSRIWHKKHPDGIIEG
jgi:hypothetical protein